MKDLLNQIAAPSLVSGFGAHPQPQKEAGPAGEWNAEGRPVDRIARMNFLKFYQGKKTSRMQTPEEIFAEPIRDGILKIVRRRGKGPQVVWL